MTDLAPTATTSVASAAPHLAVSERRTILFYSGAMILVIAFVSPTGLTAIPWAFLLKNKLHLSANGVASFVLLSSIPWYFAIVFGAVRDFWNPFGMGDRG